MRKIKRILICLLVLGLIGNFLITSEIFAQYWQAIPPYNLLWPLWSEVLSPVDPVTGNPTPLVTSLTVSTQLPVQPAWVWSTDRPEYPYFLFNHPSTGNLWYWDVLTNFNIFPTGWPPIDLPLMWQWEPPPFVEFTFASLANQANIAYLAATYGLVGALTYSQLQNPAALWGIPPFIF